MKRKPKHLDNSVDMDTYTVNIEADIMDDDLDGAIFAEIDPEIPEFANQYEVHSIDTDSNVTETSITKISLELESIFGDSVSVYIDGNTCNICANNFDEEQYRPTVLPCGHTLCYWCVRNLARQHRFLVIQCPLDRELHGCRRKDEVLDTLMDDDTEDLLDGDIEEFATENPQVVFDNTIDRPVPEETHHVSHASAGPHNESISYENSFANTDTNSYISDISGNGRIKTGGVINGNVYWVSETVTIPDEDSSPVSDDIRPPYNSNHREDIYDDERSDRSYEWVEPDYPCSDSD